MAETERSIRARQLEEELKEQLRVMKGEWKGRMEEWEGRDRERGKWVERQMKEAVADMHKLIDRKLVENEVVIRKLLLKNP